MRVSAFTTSLRATGPGAAWAMTVNASLVSSEARSTASGRARWSSWPSTEASQRRTFRTISSWVSPSKLRWGTAAQATVLTVLAGSGIGLAAGPRIPERVRTTLLHGLGLVVLVIGISDATQTRNITFPLVSLLIGGVVGEALRIEDGLAALG